MPNGQVSPAADLLETEVPIIKEQKNCVLQSTFVALITSIALSVIAGICLFGIPKADQWLKIIVNLTYNDPSKAILMTIKGGLCLLNFAVSLVVFTIIFNGIGHFVTKKVSKIEERKRQEEIIVRGMEIAKNCVGENGGEEIEKSGEHRRESSLSEERREKLERGVHKRTRSILEEGLEKEGLIVEERPLKARKTGRTKPSREVMKAKKEINRKITLMLRGLKEIYEKYEELKKQIIENSSPRAMVPTKTCADSTYMFIYEEIPLKHSSNLSAYAEREKMNVVGEFLDEINQILDDISISNRASLQKAFVIFMRENLEIELEKESDSSMDQRKNPINFNFRELGINTNHLLSGDFSQIVENLQNALQQTEPFIS